MPDKAKERLNEAIVAWVAARREKEQLGRQLAAAERAFTKANVAEREAYEAVDTAVQHLDAAEEILP